MLAGDVSAMGRAANAPLITAFSAIGRPAVARVGAGIRPMTGIAIRVVGETLARMERIAAGMATSLEAHGIATGEIMGHVRASGMDPAVAPMDLAAIHRALTETETVAANIVAAACMLCLEADRLRAEACHLFDSARAA